MDGEDDNLDDEDLGDDPFAVSAPVEIVGEKEPWLGSDRDYTYAEVCAQHIRSMVCF